MRFILVINLIVLVGLAVLFSAGCQKQQRAAVQPRPAGIATNSTPKPGAPPISPQPSATEQAATLGPVRSPYAYKPFTGGKSFAGKCLVCDKQSDALHPVNPVKPDQGGVCSTACAQKLRGDPGLLSGQH